MRLTDELLKLDPTLRVYNEGNWGSVVHTDTGYHSFNDAGIECETGEFLYAMIRILKCQLVLETGTHWGIGTSYMAMAMKDNGDDGKVLTFEFLPEIRKKALKRFETMKLDRWISSFEADVTKVEMKNKIPFDMILLDTEPQTRFAELIKFEPHLKEGGYIFIHDLHRHMQQVPNEEHGFGWPFGQMPYQIRQMVAQDTLRPFHFPTPRGLTGFYKPSKEDYKWT